MAPRPWVPKQSAQTRLWLCAQSTRCALPCLGSPSPSPPTTPGGRVAEPRSANTSVSSVTHRQYAYSQNSILLPAAST